MGPVRCAYGASAPECQSGSHGYEWRFASGTQIQGRSGRSDAVCMWMVYISKCRRDMIFNYVCIQQCC